MQPGNGIVFAGLMPHAPILVAGVGRGECARADRTIQAMAVGARHALAARADTIVVISPHSPRHSGAYGIWRTLRLRGTFADFGAADVTVDLPNDLALADRLGAELEARSVRAWWIPEERLDHGALVPLWFLVQAGWIGRTVVLGLDAEPDRARGDVGRAIAAAAEGLDRRVALIASGDMSHRLRPSSPCGFDPAGRRFDERFVAALESPSSDAVTRIGTDLSDAAAEDVVAPVEIALAAVAAAASGRLVLSYEGPFGVGYGVAILYERGPAGGEVAVKPEPGELPARIAACGDLPRVARAAVAARLQGGTEAPPGVRAGKLRQRGGVFVTIRTETGELRGCQGAPVALNDVVADTWHHAIHAALHDPRFPPVAEEELPRLRFSVSLLGALETVGNVAELDPATYGILVTAWDGRRGLLLPGIAGVTTAGEQIAIAREKGGIGPTVPVAIERFTTEVFEERIQADSAGAPHDGGTAAGRGPAG